MDTNLVEIWLRKDPKRIMAGAFAGAFAGLVALLFSMVIAVVFGSELWFPVKVPAVILLGGSAMDYGFHTTPILVGLIMHEVLCIVLGMVYSHFTGTNYIPALLGAGFTWGAFSWVFIQCLFTQSFTEIFALRLPHGIAFFTCMVFGLSLASVAFFDQMLRGRS